MSAIKPEWIVNVDDTDFEREVLSVSHEKPVVVDFRAPWCGPCRALTPILEKVIGEHQGEVIFAKVNIDESPNLAQQFQIQGIPLVIGFRHGKPAAEFAGVQPEASVRQFVQQLLPSEADKLVALARSVEAIDPAQAELTYLQAWIAIAVINRPHLAWRVYLSRMAKRGGAHFVRGCRSLGRGRDAESDGRPAANNARMLDETTLRQRLEKEPKDALARFELGCVLAAKEQYPEALEMLLSAAEADPKLASSKVREAMVHVFQIVGLHSALTNEYRNKLSTLLY